MEPSDFGISLLDATFPESLDIDIEEQSEWFIVALKQALDGDADGDELVEGISEIQAALKASCLRPLFS
jgi:hypothetical protein